MSNKDKKQSGDKNQQNNPRQGKYESGNESTKRSNTTREEWNKIDKKGQGAGDRPKR